MSERRIVDIGPLLEDLKKELEDLEGATEVLTVEEAAEDEIEELKKLPVIDPQKMIPAWRDPDKDPPKVETEVLVLYRCNGYLGITTAHYENGNVFSEDSEWNWEDLSDWGTYDEERDGDLMRDPDVTMGVDRENGTVEPLTYQNDYIGRYWEVYKDFVDGKPTKYYPAMKKDLAAMVTAWAKNIKAQGFDPAVHA